MAGANPSAYGGEGGFPKFVHCDREGEIVNPRFLGTTFQRRIVFPIETANPILNQFPSIGTPSSAPTAFRSGMVGLDWLMTALTNSPITGPDGPSLEFWLSGKGRDLPAGELNRILYNFFASAGQSFYDPVNGQFTAQDWVIRFENSDPVNSKTINFGAGVTPASITIPPGAVVQARFELTGAGTVRIVPEVSFGAIIGLGLPSGSFNPGPPIQGHDLLVYDQTLMSWQPSGLASALHNGRLPGLLLGGVGTVYGPNDQYIFVTQGNTPNGLQFTFLNGNINQTVGQQFDLIRADAAYPGLPAGNFGNRGFPDTVYNSRILTAAPNPAGPDSQGNGAYHFIGGRQNPGAFVPNFRVTADGHISDFTPLTSAALATLSVSAVGGITQGVSRAEAKENVAALSRLNSDHYFDSLHPVDYNYIGLATLPRTGFVIQQSEADLGANDNRIFSFLPGSPIDLTYRADFDNRALIAILVEQVRALKARVAALEA